MSRKNAPRVPKDPEGERARIWAEARRLRLGRVSGQGDGYRHGEVKEEGYEDRRPVVRVAVAEPEDDDDRDLIDWFADECPLDGGPGVRDWKYAPRLRTLWWMLTRRERKIVDGCDRV